MEPSAHRLMAYALFEELEEHHAGQSFRLNKDPKLRLEMSGRWLSLSLISRLSMPSDSTTDSVVLTVVSQ